jgi:hypothetical protein
LLAAAVLLLAAPVPARAVHHQPRLDAIVAFARENRVPLGIEFSAPDLDEAIDASLPAATVAGDLRALFGASHNISLPQSGAAISIRASDLPAPGWLSQRERALSRLRRSRKRPHGQQRVQGLRIRYSRALHGTRCTAHGSRIQSLEVAHALVCRSVRQHAEPPLTGPRH